MQNKIWRKFASLILLVLGLVMIGAGILRGEAVTVLQKATKICLECIGIG